MKCSLYRMNNEKDKIQPENAYRGIKIDVPHQWQTRIGVSKKARNEVSEVNEIREILTRLIRRDGLRSISE